MRWRSPARGLVAPDDFIPVAEETGADRAARRVGAEEGLRGGGQLAAGSAHRGQRLGRAAAEAASFARSVISALAHSGCRPTSLELEITETVLMDESDTVLKTLGQLRELGVRIALDDFGTGYSSLGYLQPVSRRQDQDRPLVHPRSIDNRDTAAIVRAIIGLGRELGITVTAEGVETEAQLDILRREGCVEAQGYLIGVPGSARDIHRFLRQDAAQELGLMRLAPLARQAALAHGGGEELHHMRTQKAHAHDAVHGEAGRHFQQPRADALGLLETISAGKAGDEREVQHAEAGVRLDGQIGVDDRFLEAVREQIRKCQRQIGMIVERVERAQPQGLAGVSDRRS